MVECELIVQQHYVRRAGITLTLVVVVVGTAAVALQGSQQNVFLSVRAVPLRF
jgi:hypothetical protein